VAHFVSRNVRFLELFGTIAVEIPPAVAIQFEILVNRLHHIIQQRNGPLAATLDLKKIMAMKIKWLRGLPGP